MFIDIVCGFDFGLNVNFVIACVFVYFECSLVLRI